jgi:hypothetical protein
MQEEFGGAQSFPGSQLACLPLLQEMLHPGQCLVLPTLHDVPPPGAGHAPGFEMPRSSPSQSEFWSGVGAEKLKLKEVLDLLLELLLFFFPPQ